MKRSIKRVPVVENLEYRSMPATGLAVHLHAVRTGPSEVTMTLSETNTTDHIVGVTDGCGVTDFALSQSGVEVWRKSQDGPQPLCPLNLNEPLAPHATRVFKAVWKGTITGSPPPDPSGTFQATAKVDGFTVVAPVTRGGAPSVGVLTVVVTPDRTFYRVGQPVRLTVTETNTGGQPIFVGIGGPSGATITRRNVPVWRYVNRNAVAQLALNLDPGMSRSYTLIWPGRFNVNTGMPGAGSFKVVVRIDGGAGSAAFTIRRVRASTFGGGEFVS